MKQEQTVHKTALKAEYEEKCKKNELKHTQKYYTCCILFRSLNAMF